MNTDPIADLLTRIRNAYKAQKDSVRVPHSKTKMAILKVLKARKFINGFEEMKHETIDNAKEIEIDLNQERRDITLKRVSKPGQRIYAKSITLKKINGGLGVAIISTPKGIMTAEEAKKMNIGGELICEIY